MEFIRIAGERYATVEDINLTVVQLIDYPASGYFPTAAEFRDALDATITTRINQAARSEQAAAAEAARTGPITEQREFDITYGWMGFRICLPYHWPELGLPTSATNREIHEAMGAIARGARPSVLRPICKAIREHRGGLIPRAEVKQGKTFRARLARTLSVYGDRDNGFKQDTINDRATALCELEGSKE